MKNDINNISRGYFNLFVQTGKINYFLLAKNLEKLSTNIIHSEQIVSEQETSLTT